MQIPDSYIHGAREPFEISRKLPHPPDRFARPRDRAMRETAQRRPIVHTWCLANGGIALIGFAIFFSGELGAARKRKKYFSSCHMA